MIKVRDVLYLLDLDDKPIKSIRNKNDLSIEHIDDRQSTMTVSVSMSEKLIVEQQLIYRGNRYTISEIETDKSERQHIVTAEIAYLTLSDVTRKVNRTGSALQLLAEDVVEDTGWVVARVDATPDNHSIQQDEKQPVLSTLRFLSTISGLKLVFDSVNRTVSYVNDEAGDIGFLFRYRKNLQGVTKTEYAPKATTLIPYGKDGMTIESVNGGKNYVEDFSWYESQGYTIEEARQRFNKEKVLEDNRFVYAGELMRYAQQELETLSRPQVAYEVSLAFLDQEVSVGQYGYVVDAELDIKVNVKIVRLIEHENIQDNEIELSYLAPDLSDTQDSSSSSSGSGGDIPTAQGKNERRFVATSSYNEAVSTTLTISAPTHLMVHLYMQGEVSQQSIIRGIFDLSGKTLEQTIGQVVLAGPNMIDLSFLIPQVQEGSYTLSLRAMIENGSYTIEEDDAQLVVQGANLEGGMGNEAPSIDVTEEVEFPRSINVNESVGLGLLTPIPITGEEVELPNGLDVKESVTITLG